MLFQPSLQIPPQQGSPYRDMGNVPVTLYLDYPCLSGEVVSSTLLHLLGL